MRFRSLIKAAFPIMGFAALCFSIPASADNLVILHTNDTHSAIDPNPDGTGGALQRKAIIDSVRNAERHVIAVDAGDMVQGTLYFKYFRGDVEYPIMNMTGYDIRILGNHEFDNGMADLAERYKTVKGDRLSANYDFSGTPLEGVFKPYVIKKVDGKKIGFIGINIDPTSLISKKNIDVNFLPPVETANKWAGYLKEKKKCDLVVAVTHIGYTSGNGKPSDVDLAKASKDIDIIIGAHSHTLVDPAHPEINPSIVKNADGKPVRIVQTGKAGKYVGKITVDLDRLKGADGEDYAYELIPVTDRFPEEKLDRKMREFLKPYRHLVDSVNSHAIAESYFDLTKKENKWGQPNMTADFGYWYGNLMADSLRRAGHDVHGVDLAIMNIGGIRQPMPKGDITEGQILSTYPFSNRFVIVELKGADIIEAMRVAAKKGGEAVSHNVRILTDADGNLVKFLLNGEEMGPEKTYVLGSIDYVAEGNDDMVTLANHRKIWVDDAEVAVPILRWFMRQGELGNPVAPDLTPRFMKSTKY